MTTTTATPPTVEERLAAIEARLGATPLAVPPMTIGELTNVPVPGANIAAAWAQDVSSRIVQRFANAAALTAWAAPNGAYAVQLDTGVVWRRVGAVWSRFSPWLASAVGVASPGTQPPGAAVVNTLNIPSDPGPRVAVITAYLRIANYYNASTIVDLKVDNFLLTRAGLSPSQPGPDLYPAWNLALPINYNIAPGVGAAVTVVVTNQTGATGSIYVVEGNAYSNRIDVTVHPRAGF